MKHCLLPLAGLISLLSILALIINHCTYQYPVNNYFPPNTFSMLLSLILLYLGSILQFGKDSRVTRAGLELLFLFGIMSLVALATNATQLTPYPTIDDKIEAIELYFHINMIQIIGWTSHHSLFKNILGFIYDSLNYQMCFIPLIAIVMGKFKLLRDYYFLVLFTALIGFGFYYFFPTTAPASIINSSLFSPFQIVTGLKFYQLHHHIPPTTIEGGLVALPSFHCIWALLCVYLLKDWPIPCCFLLIINLLLMASCVLLGWHYVVDVVGGMVLLGMGFYCLRLCKRSARRRGSLGEQESPRCSEA